MSHGPGSGTLTVGACSVVWPTVVTLYRCIVEVAVCGALVHNLGWELKISDSK